MKKNPVLKILFSLILIFFIYIFKCLQPHTISADEIQTGLKRSCEEIQQQRNHLYNTLKIVTDIFEKHDLPVFLVFGSVWGSLRGHNGPLPWDYDVDLGMEHSQYSSLKMDAIATEVGKFDVKVNSEVTQSGGVHYSSTENHHAKIDLFVFRRNMFGMAWRVGWEPYLLFPHYFYFQTFPYHLIENSQDLKMVQFGKTKIRIPREGIEMMKYLYRDNWNREMKPKGYNC